MSQPTIEKTPGGQLPEFSWDSIDNLEVGAYRLETAPTLEQLQSLLGYQNQKGQKAEVGIVALNGEWFIGLNEGLIAWLPARAFSFEDEFDFDLHTHPSRYEDSCYPAWGDIVELRKARYGVAYIACHDGIAEYHIPESTPGEYYDYHDLNDTQAAYTHYVFNVIGLDKQTVDEDTSYRYLKDFFTEYYGYRLISWADEVAINDILSNAS